MYFVGDLKRVAVRLAVDVQKNSRFPVGADNGVDRLHRGCDGGDVPDAYRDSGRRGFDDDLRDLFRTFHLTINQSEEELVIALEQPGRLDDIGAANCIEDVSDCGRSTQQFGRIRSNMKLRFLSTLHHHCSYAVQSIESRL